MGSPKVKPALQRLGQDVRNARLRRRIAIADLALRAGTSPSTVARLERGDPAPTEVRVLLWWLEQMKAGQVSGAVPTLPPNGLTSMVADTTMPSGFYRMGGYRISGKRAVRVDILERLADLIDVRKDDLGLALSVEHTPRRGRSFSATLRKQKLKTETAQEHQDIVDPDGVAF